MAISIGMPFFNVESYLADAIRSVFAQTYADWELILVNDGSKDRSLDIAMSVKDARVRVISDGENKGLAYRLNQITREARFDLIGRMDADDLIATKRFEKQAVIIDGYPEIDLVTTGICSITNDNRPIGVRLGSADERITGRRLLLSKCMVTHAAILGKKSWFLRNPYDVGVGRVEDYELWLRAYSKNDFKVYLLTEPLYYYREQENVSSKRILAAYASQRRLYDRYGHLGFNRIEIPIQKARVRIKSLAVRFLSGCNRMDLILKRRNEGIKDKHTVDSLLSDINQVLGTKVPGLDG